MGNLAGCTAGNSAVVRVAVGRYGHIEEYDDNPFDVLLAALLDTLL